MASSRPCDDNARVAELKEKVTIDDGSDDGVGVDSSDDKKNATALGPRALYYIHVGKTGGTSLDKYLRSNCEWYGRKTSRRQCFTNFAGIKDPKQRKTMKMAEVMMKAEEVESDLSKATIRSLHFRFKKIDEKKIIKENVTSFFWTIRNPINRAVSSFDFEHLANTGHEDMEPTEFFWKNIFYTKCGFYTAQDLADALLKQPHPKDNFRVRTPEVVKRGSRIKGKVFSVNCRRLAERTLAGIDSPLFKPRHLLNDHLSANYAFYTAITTDLFPEKEIFVVRTEELWNDISNLNRFLSSNGTSPIFQGDDTGPDSHRAIASNHRFTHGSEGFKVKSRLTLEGKETFCCFLVNENQIYEDLMRRAVNLNDEEKSKYLNILYDECGIDKSKTPNGNPDKDNSGNSSPTSFGWREWGVAGCPTINRPDGRDVLPSFV